MNNTYLCGFMGCGKTTVGKNLANISSRPFIDIDEEIVKRHGEISEIFAKLGEEEFRRIETQVLEEISRKNSFAVISTGGGCVMKAENVEIMKKHGKIVFLDTPLGHCITRILGDKKRPLASGGKQEIVELYKKRAHIYASNANITIRPEKTAARTAARLAKILAPESCKVGLKEQKTAKKFGYYVCVPTSPLYAESSTRSECVDELLYGTRLALDEALPADDTVTLSKCDLVACTTHYGYKGYIPRANILFDPLTTPRIIKTVCAHWCDLLPTPEYKYAPVAVLTKGAKVEYIHDAGERFCRVFFGKKMLYARKENFYVPINSGNIGEMILANALSYLDTPYRWGGKSPSGIDCSGLAFMAHALCGIPLFRDAVFKEEYVSEIPREDLAAGDLIYFEGHVAIYAGDGDIVHASATFGKVVKTPLAETNLEILHYARAKNI